jgi:hypothetical protein
MSQYKAHTMLTLRVGLNDLAVLRSVILNYLTHARRALPHTQQRKAQLLLLEGVYRRLASIPLQITTTQLLLQEAEIHALEEAITTFASFVQQKVSPSPERDRSLSDLENLRQSVAHMLFTS